MFGTGSRFWFGLAVLGYVGALAFGIASGGQLIGVLSIGWKGGVGEHLGYGVLLGFAVVTATLGLISTLIRDADPVLVAAGGVEVLPEAPAPTSASPWPLVGAVGLVVTALGLVMGFGFVILGLVILGITVVEWAVKVWADRATGDPAVNRTIRNRFMAPIEIPMGATLVIAFVVIGVSRVFLAVSATTAWVLASVVAIVIMIGALIVLSRPKQAGRVATALLVLGALAVLAGGIAGVAAGEREFHHEEPAEEGGGHSG